MSNHAQQLVRIGQMYVNNTFDEGSGRKNVLLRMINIQ